MLDKIKNTINKYSMLSDSSDVTVAVSGGADSVCLLCALCELKKELGLTLSAFHLNHCLRGEESDRDEEFVKQLCEKLGVPLTSLRADVAKQAAERGESIELCARNIRYELYKKHSNGLVAVAHTMSDNLETVIYNTARGSGIKGLCGIPPVRDIYIRPLIDCTREEVEAYLDSRGIDYVTDSTNLHDDYSRNFIRHNIVPALKKLNPSVEQTVKNAVENLREDAEFLDCTATKIYRIVEKSDGLDAELLLAQPPSVIKRVLGMYFYDKSGLSADSMHIVRMYESLYSGKKISLPHGLCGKSDTKRFRIYSDREEKPACRFETETVCKRIDKDDNVYNLLLKNAIDCDKIKGSLKVRTRLEGDSIRLSGRNCTKTLKKLYNELKIPQDIRDALPVAADDEGILWIHTVGVSERAAVDENTVRVISFNVKEI